MKTHKLHIHIYTAWSLREEILETYQGWPVGKIIVQEKTCVVCEKLKLRTVKI